MKFKDFIPPIFEKAILSLTSPKLKNYKIGRYNIDIPDNFSLPGHQVNFKLYDRFLPVLAKNVDSPTKVIIDVGANIGDTAIAMLQECSNPIICIEPSDVFFKYLETNLGKLNAVDRARIKTIKSLAGSGSISGTLDHNTESTASIKIAENPTSETHVSLDKLIADNTNVIMLKVDTDGFDFDVIRSAKQILTESEPVLFWENEISEDFQFNGYLEMYEILKAKGYKYLYIFDNFGNLIAEESDFNTLENINRYLFTMKTSNTTRTFYYTDVLAVTDKYHHLAQKAISDFRKEWIYR
ncbi:MAG: FkbM family methyltransferase [Bacteroidota bacterium]